MQTESKPTDKNIRSYLHILCDNPKLLWTDINRSTGQSYEIDVMHLYLFKGLISWLQHVVIVVA